MAYRDPSPPELETIPYGPLDGLLAEWMPLGIFLGIGGLFLWLGIAPPNPEANRTVAWVLLALVLVPVALLLRFLVPMPTRVCLVLDPGARTLTVTTWRLRFLRNERTLSVDGVRQVVVDWGWVKRWTHRSQRGRDLPGDLAARLVLRYDDGEERPLTDEKLVGTAAHDDAAAALRERLGLPPQARTFAPPPEAEKRKSRLAAALALGVPLLVTIVAFSAQYSIDSREAEGGAVELTIRAQESCRFRGMALLPDASTRQQLAPGTYTIRVADPSAPGGWRDDTIVLRAGQGPVEFVCR